MTSSLYDFNHTTVPTYTFIPDSIQKSAVFGPFPPCYSVVTKATDIYCTSGERSRRDERFELSTSKIRPQTTEQQPINPRFNFCAKTRAAFAILRIGTKFWRAFVNTVHVDQVLCGTTLCGAGSFTIASIDTGFGLMTRMKFGEYSCVTKSVL